MFSFYQLGFYQVLITLNCEDISQNVVQVLENDLQILNQRMKRNECC